MPTIEKFDIKDGTKTVTTYDLIEEAMEFVIDAAIRNTEVETIKGNRLESECSGAEEYYKKQINYIRNTWESYFNKYMEVVQIIDRGAQSDQIAAKVLEMCTEASTLAGKLNVITADWVHMMGVNLDEEGSDRRITVTRLEKPEGSPWPVEELGTADDGPISTRSSDDDDKVVELLRNLDPKKMN